MDPKSGCHSPRRQLAQATDIHALPLATTRTLCLEGISPTTIDAKTDLSSQLPTKRFEIDPAIQAAKDGREILPNKQSEIREESTDAADETWMQRWPESDG